MIIIKISLLTFKCRIFFNDYCKMSTFADLPLDFFCEPIVFILDKTIQV